MRRLLLLTAAVIAIPATAAQAAAFPGDPVDGPGAGSEVQSLGDVDLARDGTGALTYVKRVDGLDEIFVARFDAGVFAAGERVDAGLPGAGSQPVVGASDGGRLAVAFVNDGIVYGVVRPAGQGYAAPVPLGIGSDPSVDLSINGTAYASFTSGGDVRVARLDRRTNTWGLLDQAADVDPANVAGVGSARSRVAISADGIGVVTWGESGHVYARKMFGMALSNAPQDLTPATFADRVSTVSDLPDIDAEDDSSYAWVVFRQTFADGGSRILARRQRGTAFDPPVAIDAGGGEPVRAPDIDLNGRGVGLATTSGAITGQPIAALLDRDLFDAGTGIFSPSAAGPAAAAAMSENNDGYVASVLAGPGEAPFVRVLTYDDRKPTKELVISRPELGPVVPELGFDAAVDRGGGAIIAWIQASPAGRQLVAGLFDREPGTFAGFTAARCCQPALAKLSWSTSFGLWGAHTYQVRVDGQLVGRDGEHAVHAHDAARGADPSLAGDRGRHPRPDAAHAHAAAARGLDRAAHLLRLQAQEARRERLGARPRRRGRRDAVLGHRGHRHQLGRQDARSARDGARQGAPPLRRAGHVSAGDHRPRQGRQRHGSPARGGRGVASRGPVRRHAVAAAGRTLALGERPWLMGIVNASPDSFSDAGAYPDLEARVELARELLAAGADIIDVGGESGITLRPPVAVAEEIERVVPLIERIAGELGALVSVDTYKPAVAEAAIAAGAAVVNDVSGLRDPELAAVCARTGAALVLMHTRAAPKQRLQDARALRGRRRRRPGVPRRADRGRARRTASATSSSSSTRGRTSPRRRPRRSRCWRAWRSCTRSGARCCSPCRARTSSAR